MELKQLCGKHILQGVDRRMYRHENIWGEEVETDSVWFKVDGITYVAVENPSDGWRSYCEDLFATEQSPRYNIPDVPVVCEMMPDGEDWMGVCRNEVLIIRDASNNKVILEVGTENFDDYYPYCHFEYHPENLSCNDFVNIENGENYE